MLIISLKILLQARKEEEESVHTFMQEITQSFGWWPDEIADCETQNKSESNKI